jgi:hypothetical protein
LKNAASFTSAPAAYIQYYEVAPPKVPSFGFRSSDNFRLHSYGRRTCTSGSKTQCKSSQERGTATVCFVLQEWWIQRDAEAAED